MDDDPAAALTQLVARARAALAGQPVDVPEGPFVATAADDLVSAEVDVDGRVVALRMDPKMMRQPAQDICAAMREAINAALAARPSRPDTKPLLDELRAVQEQSVHEMARITHAFSDALARIGESR